MEKNIQKYKQINVIMFSFLFFSSILRFSQLGKIEEKHRRVGLG